MSKEREEDTSAIISAYGSDVPNGFRLISAVVKDDDLNSADAEALHQAPNAQYNAREAPMAASALFSCPKGYAPAFNGSYYYCKKIG